MRTRFSQFIVDSETRQLLVDGTEVHLSPKAFDLLCVLLARRPNVVGKEQLLQLVWPNTYVAEANLNVLVAEVRRAIGDSPQAPRCIRTVHGVGYAFCATTTDVQTDQARCWLLADDRRFALSEGDNIIGRDPSCNVWLDDPDVSRRHARIRIDSIKKTAVLEDLDSTNGTMIGKSAIKKETALADADVVRFGPVQLTFRDGSDKPQVTRRIRRKVQ
jgi:DNA-binding winged helix-turn-helix (wHTH) protein